MTEQRLAHALVENFSVGYVDPGRTPRRLNALFNPRILERDGIAVARVNCLPFSKRLNWTRHRQSRARAAATLLGGKMGGAFDVIICTGLSGALDSDAVRDAKKLLLVMDDYVAGAQLIGSHANIELEHLKSVAQKVDRVVCVSPVLQDRLGEMGILASIIPNGCSTPPTEVAEAGHREPAAVFLGGISPRVNVEILKGIVKRGVPLRVIGAVSNGFPSKMARDEVVAFLGSPEVEWHGLLPEEDAWDLCRKSSVGVVPYIDDAFNQASFPLKILEYLALGLPVVSTPLASVDWLQSPDILSVPAEEDFSAAVQLAIANTDNLIRSRCVHFASQHTWKERARAWVDLIDKI